MTDRSPTFIGIDPASPGGDWSVEVEATKTEDGKLVIRDFWRWRHTIEGTAIRVEDEDRNDG